MHLCPWQDKLPNPRWMFRIGPIGLWLLRHLRGKFSGHPIEARLVLWTCVSYLLTLKGEKCAEKGSQPVPPVESADPPPPDRDEMIRQALAFSEASCDYWARPKSCKADGTCTDPAIGRETYCQLCIVS